MSNQKPFYRKKEFRDWARRLSLIVLSVLLIVTIFYKRIFIPIDSGEAGVLYDFWTGTRMDKVYHEGMQVISPLNKIYKYNTRTQKLEFDQNVLTRDGLSVNVKHTVLYHPELFYCQECGMSSLSKIHRQYGPDYANLLISPAAQSWIRKLIGVLTPEEIFMRQKGLIERNEKDSLGLLLKHSHIDIESYFIKSIVLPDSVNFAIESKFRQQQLNEEYTFKIQVEEKELKRKEIEAFGIRRFQEVSGVSPVQWKALDVTQSVATSPNTKVVIAGGANGGLPIFLGDQFNMKPFNSNAVPPLPKDSIKR